MMECCQYVHISAKATDPRDYVLNALQGIYKTEGLYNGVFAYK